ncbi:hypothetical protein CP061683_0262B, partial [Chlamydia psittaci 06-1683]
FLYRVIFQKWLRRISHIVPCTGHLDSHIS